MDGIADMGGMHGFGSVDRSDEGGPFHDEWERRILGITFAALGAGLFNVDEIRRATESADPLTYLQSTYYQRWLYSTEDLLKEKGVVTARELAAGSSATPAVNAPAPVTKEIARVILEQGGTSRSADGAPPRFKPGDAVVARNIHPHGHTRLPRYVRGKRGTIVVGPWHLRSAGQQLRRPWPVLAARLRRALYGARIVGATGLDARHAANRSVR